MKRMITTLVLIITQMYALVAQSGETISLSATTTDSQCSAENGPATGSIDLMVSGGTPPYQYIWSEGSITEDLTNLDVGLYCVTVTDSEDNTKNSCYDLGGPDPLTLIIVGTHPECHHLNSALTGAIDISIYGGTVPYSYEWQGPGIMQGIEDQYSLGEGTYNVTITDANGCQIEDSYTLVEPEELIIQSEVTQPECMDGIQILGAINLTASGGTPPFTYSWTGPSADWTAMNQTELQEGVYNVTVTDSNGCDAHNEFIIESTDKPLSIESTVNNISCANGDQTLGSIELTISGGVAPYSFVWSDNAADMTAQNQSNLNEGTYSVTVTDAEGCQFRSLDFEITKANTPVAPSICLITNDNPQGNNQLYWESNDENVSYFNIYREGNISNEFDLIGNVVAADLNSYMDTEVSATQQAYRYNIKAVNSCGTESEASDIHKTIHLTINQGVNGNINLIWDEYNGINYDQLTIYRGDSPDNMQPFTVLASNISSYTDENALTSESYYQIGLSLPINCDIGKGSYQLRSNIASNIPSSVIDINNVLSIAPNPFNEQIHIEIENDSTVEIMDTKGRIVLAQQLTKGNNTIHTSHIPKGIYFAKITSDKGSSFYKLLH